MKLIYGLMALLLTASAANAQEHKEESKDKKKKGMTISIGSDGGIDVKEHSEDSTKLPKVERDVEVEFGMIDVGINSIMDKTDYTSAAAKNFMQVPAGLQNENLFALRTGKSFNVNIWPVMVKLKVLKTSHQKIYLSTGIGLQIYNFRYSKDITHINETVPQVTYDSVTGFTKNKVVLNYLTIPLQLTFKTKMADKLWLVYGFGVTGGYRIDSWTKQVSAKYGKQKNHDSFNFADFNSCVTAEFGLDNYFRLYASYQLTNMYANALDQQPFCIGLRFGGM